MAFVAPRHVGPSRTGDGTCVPFTDGQIPNHWIRQGSNPCPLHWQAGSYPLDTWEAHGIFSCGMWDLVPWSGTAPTPLPWMQSLSHSNSGESRARHFGSSKCG